jgi:hypothetical protein
MNSVSLLINLTEVTIGGKERMYTKEVPISGYTVYHVL